MPSSCAGRRAVARRTFRGRTGELRWSRLDSFNQGGRQPKRPAQLRFLARHFTIIALMVKARQMQYSVQRQNLDFLRRGMPEAERILKRNVGGDRDLARQLRCVARLLRSKKSAGNDSTSVALFWLRKRWLSERTAALLVTSTFTCPLRPAALRARSTKRSQRVFVQSHHFLFQNHQAVLQSRSLSSDRSGTKSNRRARSRPSANVCA